MECGGRKNEVFKDCYYVNPRYDGGDVEIELMNRSWPLEILSIRFEGECVSGF